MQSSGGIPARARFKRNGLRPKKRISPQSAQRTQRGDEGLETVAQEAGENGSSVRFLWPASVLLGIGLRALCVLCGENRPGFG